ncbi:hypothetical protein [Methanomassiliicoccus luminyensis]|jgi:hypothetical protein|uniref:hypothetical protein n=1 Tax=Methanomassiliicoccus luminyensis TaxID=1080712 RepID=UPI00036E160E|nr:hypothetical protein [Methanomassiliicoccus luminyensis]
MVWDTGRAIITAMVSTIVMILLSVVYFAITLFFVRTAADIIFAESVSVDWAVLAAAIITFGSMVGAVLGSRQ